MTQPTKTPLEASLISRVAAGVRYAITGAYPDAWMSPMAPMTPTTTPKEQESTRDRQFDYAVGFNQRVTPRQGEANTFATLRSLADGYDLMRLAIETRKDQLASLSFVIAPMDDTVKPDARCAEVAEFLRFPDRENSWHDWLRQIVEDMLVIDAVSIYPRKTLGGKPYSFDLIDGATVSRKINEFGRTPEAPEVAYQQVFKGVPAVNYTADELVYAPRNKRTNKIYGYSPVEQVMTTVNIALRRQLTQLEYYTEGSTPNLLMFAPPDWTPDQITRFQKHWDSLLRGNTAERAGAKLIPNGVVPFNTKDAALKDAFDEWLARIICYAFSISPQALVAQMNRATAETASDDASKEGLAPLKVWIKGVIDALIFKHFGYTDIHFTWAVSKDIKPKELSEIHKIYVESKVLTADEVRIELGREPLTPEEREAAFPAPIAPAEGGKAENKDKAPITDAKDKQEQ